MLTRAAVHVSLPDSYGARLRVRDARAHSLLALGVRRMNGAARLFARRTLGAIALALGIAIVVWFVYNLFAPTPEFRHGYRSVLQLVLPIAMIGYGWRWLSDGGPGIETLQIPPDAPELVASVAQARRTLDGFLGEVAHHVDGAFIKFPLGTDAGAIEHIWAYVHHYDARERTFNVSLASTPFTQKAPIESRRDVPLTNVEDWQIMTRDGRIRGGYSLRALFEHVACNGIRLNRTMRKQRAQFLDSIEPR